jgi:elongation factor Ts
VTTETAKTAGGDLKIAGFVRYERGEGIEKPQGDDFASEVAKMAGG